MMLVDTFGLTWYVVITENLPVFIRLRMVIESSEACFMKEKKKKKTLVYFVYIDHQIIKIIYQFLRLLILIRVPKHNCDK